MANYSSLLALSIKLLFVVFVEKGYFWSCISINLELNFDGKWYTLHRKSFYLPNCDKFANLGDIYDVLPFIFDISVSITIAVVDIQLFFLCIRLTHVLILRSPGVGVTKSPFLIFSISKIFDLAKVLLGLFGSHLYLTGAAHLSNINVIFNS